MKIMFISPESAPFCATGGLGDVAGALPAALASSGAEVVCVMPKYSLIPDKYTKDMKYLGYYYTDLAWRHNYCGAFEYKRCGVRFIFIDNEYYFAREKLYGEYDDGERFAFFCRSVFGLMDLLGFYPDILHSNDWQTALCPVYLLRAFSKEQRFSSIRTLHTIHNIEYQGIFGTESAGDVFALYGDDVGTVMYKNDINLTKGAIVCADRINTVSPRYAEEIRYPYYSHGLDGILSEYGYKLSGILNGIDNSEYAPEKDTELYRNFSADDISPKKENKLALQKELSLPLSENTPLICMISRLVSHKGIDLVVRVLDELMCDDVQFIILGTGDEKYENFFKEAVKRYGDRLRAEIRFDRALAKRIYASSDIFLMPSRTEPCGLAQMIACRYGTVPLVRETGGLADSIKHYEPLGRSGNGFTFYAYNAHEMLFKLRDMLSFYRLSHSEWEALAKRIMTTDFSNKGSAEKYLSLYRDIRA